MNAPKRGTQTFLGRLLFESKQSKRKARNKRTDNKKEEENPSCDNNTTSTSKNRHNQFVAGQRKEQGVLTKLPLLRVDASAEVVETSKTSMEVTLVLILIFTITHNKTTTNNKVSNCTFSNGARWIILEQINRPRIMTMVPMITHVLGA